MSATRQEILGYVLGLLQELVRDWDYARPVGPETHLFSELGFESLDAVVLGTAIQEHYQRPMPFAELFAGLGQREVRDLSVAELVEFIGAHLDSRVGGSRDE